MLKVRPATLDDVPMIAALFDAYRQFYAQAANAKLAQSFIHARLSNGESHILIAELAANMVGGFCQLYPTFCSVEAAPILVLYDVFVAPAYRRQGIGRLLMRAAEAYAAAGGFARMDLTTAKTNLQAQALYESVGWRRDDVFYTYHKPVPE